MWIMYKCVDIHASKNGDWSYADFEPGYESQHDVSSPQGFGNNVQDLTSKPRNLHPYCYC